MNYNKTGMELALGTVVIAVLLLIVLAVAAYIFLQGAGGFRSGISCQGADKSCVETTTCSDENIIGGWLCPEGQICCRKG